MGGAIVAVLRGGVVGDATIAAEQGNPDSNDVAVIDAAATIARGPAALK